MCRLLSGVPPVIISPKLRAVAIPVHVLATAIATVAATRWRAVLAQCVHICAAAAPCLPKAALAGAALAVVGLTPRTQCLCSKGHRQAARAACSTHSQHDQLAIAASQIMGGR